MDSEKKYIAIDLKSFYASVEAVERNLDPLNTHLVVADESRTDKTICLAVTPPLKACGVPSRPRLFEVIQQVKYINEERRRNAPGKRLIGKSYHAPELKQHPELALDYLIAQPRMELYMKYSTHITGIYRKYIAPEDIHVYSVDEVFIDVTPYLKLYRMTAQELASMLISDVFSSTGITATAGVGPNLFLCKVAMDIVAKHMPPNENGVRMAELDEMKYRRLLWSHRPITDFWRVGGGSARKLAQQGIFTMGDVARCSAYHEDLLYRLFGVNAELLIDHAWGWEPCTMQAVKSYRPSSNSLSTGQVLQRPYSHAEARLIVKEMTDNLALDLVDKRLVTDQMVLAIGYDTENLSDPLSLQNFPGEIVMDHYGRLMPKHAHGSINLSSITSSAKIIMDAVLGLYEQITDPKLSIRRITLAASRVWSEQSIIKKTSFEQLDMFTDYDAEWTRRQAESIRLSKERSRQEAVLNIRKRFGKNAILKGMNLEEGATAMERNQQIGGHRA